MAALPRKCRDSDDDDRTPTANGNANANAYTNLYAYANPYGHSYRHGHSNGNGYRHNCLGTNSDSYSNSIACSGRNGLSTRGNRGHLCDQLHSAGRNLSDQWFG